MNALIQELSPLMPEVFLALAGLWLLVAGVFGREGGSARIINLLVVLACVAAAAGIVYGGMKPASVWNGLLAVNEYTQVVKLLLVTAAVLVLTMTSGWLSNEKNFEYPLLALFSLVGMLLLVSANDLLTFYLAFELMSLPLYVLASIERDNLRSTEAGIKYFVLGSLASGLLLFGMSLLYGFVGTTSFAGIADALRVMGDPAAPTLVPGVTVGLVLILTGVFFKISAVPFHMWTPDVYEGTPTPVTAFFAVLPKIAALAFFGRLLSAPLDELMPAWQQIVIVVSILTMTIGALGALAQTNIKRLLAYSSIGHVGYALVGIAAGNVAGLKGLIIYLALYLFMSAGSFGIVMLMKREGRAVESIDELSGMARTHPRTAFALAAFLFSMAGIPPLAGFFGKLYVFLAAVQSGLFVLAVIGVLTSVIACYYYIKIVKLMYFDEPKAKFDMDQSPAFNGTVILCAAVTLFFIFVPGPLVAIAARAAEAVFL